MATVALLFGFVSVALTADGILLPHLSVASISAQRVFRDTIPSVADYTQTAHSQAQAIPVSSNTSLASPICGAAICGPNSNWVMWDTPFMQFDKMKATGNYGAYDFRSAGFATGVSRLFGEYTAIGLALGYDERKITGDSDPSAYARGDGDTFHATLYGGTGFGNFFVDAYAGFSWTSERISLAGTPGGYGNYNDSILSGGFKASYVWCLENEVRIAPYLGFDYSRLHNNPVAYHQGGQPVAIDRLSHNSAQLPIGVAVNRTFYSDFLAYGGNRSLWTPEIRAAVTPQFGARQIRNTVIGTSDIISSAPASRYIASIGTGMKIQINDRFILAIDYDYRFGKRYSSHLVTGTYGVSF
jgi:outer membrane autotransporter protein